MGLLKESSQIDPDGHGHGDAGICKGVKEILHTLLAKLNKRFTLINQKSPAQNARAGIGLISGLALLGTVYFLFAYSTLKGLWYHKALCGFSTLVFVFLCKESYFEIYEKRIKKDLPDTLKKLTHYYNHYKGNIIPALEDTISRCPRSNRIYIINIKDALIKPDYQSKIEELENKMPLIWLKMLCRLILSAKENGGESPAGDVVSNNLKRMTDIVTFLNIEQGYNDAELMGMEVFVFCFPFLVIPMTKWYNISLLSDLNLGDIYGSIQAHGLTAIMMFISAVGAAFIHWMRKLQS